MTLEEFLSLWHGKSPVMEVCTSGSTGTPKPILVDKERMRASARMTCRFLGLHHGDTALLCMPLEYIAGRMMVVRSLEWGLRLLEVEPSGHPLSEENLRSIGMPKRIDFAAMVPLQVWNTLQVTSEREALCRVGCLIIGGGAISAPLEEALRELPVSVWSTYGMTETLSHVALRRIPERGYLPLPGVSLAQDVDGCLVIEAPALCAKPLVTNDIVRFIGGGRFEVVGRRDNTICSGGIKIQPEEVEAWLEAQGVKGVMVTYRPDVRLGQAVVWLCAEYVDTSRLTPPTSGHGSRYWLPRHVVHVASLPLTPTGKPDRAKARLLALGRE